MNIIWIMHAHSFEFLNAVLERPDDTNGSICLERYMVRFDPRLAKWMIKNVIVVWRSRSYVKMLWLFWQKQPSRTRAYGKFIHFSEERLLWSRPWSILYDCWKKWKKSIKPSIGSNHFIMTIDVVICCIQLSLYIAEFFIVTRIMPTFVCRIY